VYTNGYFSTNGTYYSSRSRLALSQDDGYIPTTEWVHDVLPTGVVIAYAAATTPDGWLFCDGSLVSKTTYAALYTVIGTSYGYDLFDSSVFRLPDYRHKFLRGHYSETLDSSASGGYDSVALSASNLPAHTHTVAAMANGTGTNFGGSGSFTQSNGSGTAGTLTTSSVGSGSAFSIIPTHHLVRYIIKYT
jgi:microcystin-dependent protein